MKATNSPPFRKAFAVLRPEALALVDPKTPDAWRGIVVARRFAGSGFVYRVALTEDLAVEVASTGGTVGEADSVGVIIEREPEAVRRALDPQNLRDLRAIAPADASAPPCLGPES